MTLWSGVKRRVFISFYKGDSAEVIDYARWADKAGVMTPYLLDRDFDDSLVRSNDTDYVMRIIRRDFIRDSTVTLVMLGSCTHGRRYVDWEIKASLRQGEVYTPNGLFGMTLPSSRFVPALPPRFEANCRTGYAAWYKPLCSVEFLGAALDAAYAARSGSSHLIVNPADRMRYSRQCQICRVTH